MDNDSPFYFIKSTKGILLFLTVLFVLLFVFFDPFELRLLDNIGQFKSNPENKTFKQQTRSIGTTDKVDDKHNKRTSSTVTQGPPPSYNAKINQQVMDHLVTVNTKTYTTDLLVDLLNQLEMKYTQKMHDTDINPWIQINTNNPSPHGMVEHVKAEFDITPSGQEKLHRINITYSQPATLSSFNRISKSLIQTMKKQKFTIRRRNKQLIEWDYDGFFYLWVGILEDDTLGSSSDESKNVIKMVLEIDQE